MKRVVGLDVGGANLKAATSFGEAYTVPFELWRKPERLSEAVIELLERWPNSERVAVTMTGELCDCFETKRDGVRAVLHAVEVACIGKEVYVWGTDGGWHTVEEARQAPMTAAAANWHALATYVGRYAGPGSALLIDVGSTTTDIIPLRAGVPIPVGKTDPDRLRSGALVYTGVRRTPVCALLQQGIAAEWFATAADVYLLMGALPENPHDTNSADGRPNTRTAAHARLARMLGGDAEITSHGETYELAERANARQRELLVEGIRKIIGPLEQPLQRVIFAGSGEFLARAAWSDFEAQRNPFPASRAEVISLGETHGTARSSAACAYALAILLEEMQKFS